MERNDAIKQNNNIAIQRYQFAADCIGGTRNVLEIGCGLGYGSSILKGLFNTVTGIDKSTEAIEYAKANYPMAEYKVVDVENDEFDYFAFDVAIFFETLCHLKNPQKFIDKIKTKELVISAPRDRNPNDGYKWRLHNLSEQQFRDMLKDWDILRELNQKDKYLVLYCKKKNI